MTSESFRMVKGSGADLLNTHPGAVLLKFTVGGNAGARYSTGVCQYFMRPDFVRNR